MRMLTIDISQTGRSLFGRPRYAITLTGAAGATLTLQNLSGAKAFSAVARVAEKAIVEDVPYRITGTEVINP